MSADPRQVLKDFINRQFLWGQRTIRDDEPLSQGQVVDSLGMIQLIAFIEKAFGVSCAPSEITIDNFNSVDAIMRFIDRKQARSTDR